MGKLKGNISKGAVVVQFLYECEECEHVWESFAPVTPCPKCGSKFTSTVEDE